MLCAFVAFTLVSVLRPCTYIPLRMKKFSNNAIQGVCVVRIVTFLIWLICLLCIETIQQWTLITANQVNGKESYPTKYADDPDKVDELDRLNFSFRLIIGYFIIVGAFFINGYIIYEMRRQVEEESGYDSVSHPNRKDQRR